MGTFVLYSSVWKSLPECCLWPFISYGAGPGLPGSYFFFSGGQGSNFVPMSQTHPQQHQGPHLKLSPALTFLPTSVKLLCDPAHPAFLPVRRESTWSSHLILVSLSNMLCVTSEKSLKIRQLGTKSEIEGYKSIQHKILIPGNAKLKKTLFLLFCFLNQIP